MKEKIPVGILGATGLLGQTYIQRLTNHPYFEITFLAASERSAKKRYGQCVNWQFSTRCPVEKMEVFRTDDVDEAKKRALLLFSALPGDIAKEHEERYASNDLAIVSNASYSRSLDDVPLVIAEVNADHLSLISFQRKKRGYRRGFIVAKPNCVVQGLLLPLAPLDRAFGLKELHLTTLQAISGAGMTGLYSYDTHDNILPFIEGEEEKLLKEPKKILGTLKEDHIEEKKNLIIDAKCHRVPILNGHFVSISCSFEKKPSLDEVKTLWKSFSFEKLPSSPDPILVYLDDKRRPQHRLDLAHSSGMAVALGGLEEANLFDIRFSSLSHNAVRGGAGGGVLTAELLALRKFI